MEDTFYCLVGAAGQQQKRFTLHNDFFIPRSDFFRAARSAAWNKEQKPTNLEDDDPEVFANYRQCIYLDNANFLPDSTKPDFAPLIKAYVIAEKLGDLVTANMIIDRIIFSSDEVITLPGLNEVHLAYSTTATGSPLRALFCDYFIHEADARYLVNRNLSEFDRDFFQDIAVRYLSIKRTAGIEKVSVGAAFGKTVSIDSGCVPFVSPTQQGSSFVYATSAHTRGSG